jgi:UDP-glucose 4-epimerase
MKQGKILVTGVAGFIGSNLAERLVKAGYEVIGIDNLAYGIPENVPQEIEFHKVDIRSQEIYPLFNGVDVVFHLAAKNDLSACQKDPVETIDINVRGTANVFEAARRAGVKKLVFASSSAVEEGEARLNGFYAISKLTDERIAKGYQEAFGLNFVALRYFNVYGPRQDYRRANPPVISALMIKLLKGEQPVLYEGYNENKRDFIYVDDINDFHLLCIGDDRVNNRMFRLGTGRSYSMKEVYDAVSSVMGVNVLPVIKPRKPEDVPTVTIADISDARSVGWSPKTSFEEGLKTQLAFLREEFAKGNLK